MKGKRPPGFAHNLRQLLRYADDRVNDSQITDAHIEYGRVERVIKL